MWSNETRQRRLEDAKRAYAALMKCYPFTTDDLDGEEWRDVKGYGGDYQTSTFGRVKSLKNGKVRILKPFLTGLYMQVELHKDDKGKTFQVNRLVAETFIPNSDNLPEVNHIDGRKLNNHVSNLEWVTHQSNMRHAVDTGLQVVIHGEDHKKAVLTNEQAAYIRENPDGLTGVELAKKFGVMPAIISNIQIGRSYKTAGDTVRKERAHPPNRIPDEVRAKICAEYESGLPGCGAENLAKKYGLVKSTIYRIVKEGKG